LNREQKAAAIAEIADEIRESDAVFAVDFRGISVPQAADVRTRLRDADARFRVVKNTLTERAADEAGAEALKELLAGPTALTFVRGDAALAAKAISTFNRETELLAFKGGLMNGEALDPAQLQAIARLPSREVLYGQLVGVVASPITGVVRGLNALISGLAVALGQVQEKKESGEIPTGAATGGGGDQTAAEAPETPGESEAGGTQASPAEAGTADQDAEAPEPPASPEEPAEGGAADTPDTDQEQQADASA
jgi:large subunit ribosomal protein L10